MEPRALSLDLFGTIVFFDGSRLPRLVVGGRERIVTIGSLEEILARRADGVSVERFFEAIDTTSREIWDEKRTTGREILTTERFRRTLEALGASDAEVASRELAAEHMRGLAESVVCPADRRELLTELARRHPLALTSNFDDGATARALLARFGLTDIFHSVVVSAEAGYVKPCKAIFDATCRGLAVEPAECLHVGDSYEADVRGAEAAGLSSLWISADDEDGAGGPRIADLRELPDWLRQHYG